MGVRALAMLFHKTFVTLFAVLLAVMGLALPKQSGILPASQPAENIPIKKEEGPVTLHILQSRGELGRYLQQAADRYTAVNPGVHIRIQTVEAPADYQVALRSRLLSGAQADLFHVLGRRDLLDLQALPCQMESLSDLSWADDTLWPGSLAAMTFSADTPEAEPRLLGLPLSVEGVGLLVNMDIFTQAGLSWNNSMTLADLADLFARLQSHINQGLLAENYPHLEAVTEFSAQDKAYLGGPVVDTLAAGSIAAPARAYQTQYLDMPLAPAAKELWRIMAYYSACTSWKQLLAVTQTRQLEDGIAAGRVAVVLQNGEAHRRIRAINPTIASHLRLMPIPLTLDDTAAPESDWPRQALFAHTPAYWCINADSPAPTKQAARQFLTWLYQSESGTALLAGSCQLISPYRQPAARQQDTSLALHGDLLRRLNNNNGEEILPSLWPDYPPEWREDTAQGLQNYLTGDLTWDNFIAQSKENWNRQSGLM